MDKALLAYEEQTFGENYGGFGSFSDPGRSSYDALY
jgi:hypothetical protein